MKKVITLCLFIFSFITIYSQGGPKWALNGNPINAADFLGTSNAMPLIFKTDGAEHFRINANGEIVFTDFSGSGNGIFTFDNTGKTTKISFTGNSTDVLLGDGTFGDLSSSTHWIQGTGYMYTIKNVGIGGVLSPTNALEVLGNTVISGSISASEMNVGTVAYVRNQLKFQSSLCMDAFDPSVPGSRNEICGLSGDVFINSKSTLNHNTIFNHSNAGNVGIGTDHPNAKLDVNGDFKVSGKSFFSSTSYVKRIAPMPGDTVIQFGDSTLYLSTSSNNIYVNPTSIGSALNKGVGIGSSAAIGKGQYSTALGFQSRANGDFSYTMGYYVRSVGNNSITIGSGISGTYLENAMANSLMIGFNSNEPTLTVTPASGAGTMGKVAIGLTNPIACFEVTCNETTPYTYATRLNVNNGLQKCWSVFDNSSGSPVENFLVYGNGKVYAREVFVKLGVLGDFVFEPDYDLMPLYEVESYYKKHKHLPRIPSEKEVIEKDLNLGEMNALLLQKVEELTLYTVQQQKEIDELKSQMKILLSNSQKK